jgi:hypothetical protein
MSINTLHKGDDNDDNLPEDLNLSLVYWRNVSLGKAQTRPPLLQLPCQTRTQRPHSLWTGIPIYTVLRFTATLDTPHSTQALHRGANIFYIWFAFAIVHASS